MKKIGKSKFIYISRRGYKNFLKAKKRTLRKKSKRRAAYNFIVNAKKLSYEKGELFYFGSKRDDPEKTKNKPAIPINSRLILSNKNSFSPERVKWRNDGRIQLPKIFSLTKTPGESYAVLKNLIYFLYKGQAQMVILDYENCNEIDLDASVCMDIIILEYNSYLAQCKKKRFVPIVKAIKPINYQKPEITKILFSIGAFRNARGFKIDYHDIICYNLCIRNKCQKSDPGLDTTEMVDYVIACLEKMHKKLTTDARKNLCDVIGEILINAEEHSTTKFRFSIGYFHEHNNLENKHIGFFNLVIFNYGDTIYEKFKTLEGENHKTVARMKELSEIYVKKSFFGQSEFTEETLWTLYALQEGVTSVPKTKFKKRGNGSIRFIESFFELKGTGMEMDNVSKLTILSGNTRIVFDGKHKIVNKIKGDSTYKIMAFNKAGNIEEQPDKKYVSFVENYFPGTLISAKIVIDDNDIQNSVK